MKPDKTFLPAAKVGHMQQATLDWSSCILCQTVTNEPLQCPAQNKRSSDRNSGYTTMASNLQSLQDLKELPAYVRVNSMKREGLSLEETFTVKEAKWHKTCALKFNTTTVNRAISKNKREASHQSQEALNISSDTEETSVRAKRIKSEKFPDICFFCDEGTAQGKGLHSVRTKEIEEKIKKCVFEIGDPHLVSKLLEGDMIARERKYHLKCLVHLYNSCRPKLSSDESDIICAVEGIAFSEILVHIEQIRVISGNDFPVFRMPDLINRYKECAQNLLSLHGIINHEIKIHHSKFREKIVNHFGDMQAAKSGKEYLLVSNGHVGESLRQNYQSFDTEAVSVYKICKSIRKRTLKCLQSFKGAFNKDCQMEDIDPLLLSLISTLLYGRMTPENRKPPQAVLTICQLIAFNIKTNQSKDNTYHSSNREPPLPVYLAMKIHSKTRNRQLIDSLNKAGISVSYDRLQRISSSIRETAIGRMMEEKAMCPPNLKRGLFTTSDYDNLDHNPSSTTNEKSFHGTSISILQHRTSLNEVMERVSVAKPNVNFRRSVPILPAQFVNVIPDYLPKKDPIPTTHTENVDTMIESDLTYYVNEELDWLYSVTCDENHLSWSAYNASKNNETFVKSICSLMPLFYEDSKSVAMMKHGMKLMKQCTNFLNPGQSSVITMDQPLYPLAKRIQWTWHEEFGEKSYFIMFGSLHIEQAFLKVLGKYLDGSGWTYALLEAGVASAGTADSYIKVSNITRSRLAHQITAACLFRLMKNAFDTEVGADNFNKDLFEEWRAKKCIEISAFQYWSQCLDMEILLLLFLKAHRNANFKLYVEALKYMMKWFFAMDFHNYARWLSVYLGDISNLQTKHPEIFNEFQTGNFVVRKTNKPFSAMGIDQAHEQNNAIVKGEGGAVGLLTDPSSLRRWMVCGPEISQLISDFEDLNKEVDSQECHHEQSPSFQKLFESKAVSLTDFMESIGNPFLERGKELFSLHNMAMSQDSVNSVMKIADIGQEQYKTFITERLVNQNINIYEPIKKNNFLLFHKKNFQQNHNI